MQNRNDKAGLSLLISDFKENYSNVFPFQVMFYSYFVSIPYQAKEVSSILNLLRFFEKFLLWQNIYNIEFAILAILSVQFSGLTFMLLHNHHQYVFF